MKITLDQCKKCLHNTDLGLLFFRLFIGLTMAFAHGLGKLPPPQQFIDGITGLGFPLPVAFAWAASLSEFAGGLLIALGLCTRGASLFLGATMSVAAFMAHAADPFNVKEMALLYLAACVLLVFTGGGKYALDTFICKKFK